MRIQNDEQLARYSIAVHDFERAGEFLARLDLHDRGTEESEALLLAAIIFYARPFSMNERSAARAIPALKIEWFSGLTEIQLDLHSLMIKYRNKVVAHAEFQHFPTALDRSTGVISSRRTSVADLSVPIENLRSLLGELSRQCHNKRGDYTREYRGVPR